VSNDFYNVTESILWKKEGVGQDYKQLKVLIRKQHQGLVTFSGCFVTFDIFMSCL
jgi:hypothetical protein